jgi:hypothetical protein
LFWLVVQNGIAEEKRNRVGYAVLLAGTDVPIPGGNGGTGVPPLPKGVVQRLLAQKVVQAVEGHIRRGHQTPFDILAHGVGPGI